MLGRSAVIMDAFNGGPPVLSLSDLNRRTHLPKSTVHRLVDQLCQVGWLERDRGGYRVGMRMFELGTLAADANRMHEAAFPHLQVLAAKTGLAAQLAILDRAEVLYLEQDRGGADQAADAARWPQARLLHRTTLTTYDL